MSGLTEPSLDLQAQIAQIARAQEETRKFVAEQHKLMAEASKLNRDRWVTLLTAAASLLAAGTGLAALARTLGH